MNEKKKPAMKTAVPVLSVEDLGEALEYYTTVLASE